MNTKTILDFIAHLESNGNYDAVYGNAASRDDLSRYTLDEIHDRQRRHAKIHGSSAFGRYQILRKTLLHLRDQLGLDGTEKFTHELQDTLGEALLAGRGLYRWEHERMSDVQFMDALSKEWASLPYHNGRSYYDGDSIGNHALASRKSFAEILDKSRRA